MTPSASARIRSALGNLSSSERRVADFVLAAPGKASRMTVGDLARECATSEATVVRFCRNAGFDGFRDLRIALATEVGRNAVTGVPQPLTVGVEPGDSVDTIVKKVAAADIRAITDTSHSLDLQALETAVSMVRNATRIQVFGVGASGLVAEDLGQKVFRIGMPVSVATEVHAALTAVALFGPGDVAIGISHSGETVDILEPLQLARNVGAGTIAITNEASSSLAKSADCVLTTVSDETGFRSGAMASRSAQMLVVDCLFLACAISDFERSLTSLDRTHRAVETRRQPIRRRSATRQSSTSWRPR